LRWIRALSRKRDAFEKGVYLVIGNIVGDFADYDFAKQTVADERVDTGSSG